MWESREDTMDDDAPDGTWTGDGGSETVVDWSSAVSEMRVGEQSMVEPVMASSALAEDVGPLPVVRRRAEPVIGQFRSGVSPVPLSEAPIGHYVYLVAQRVEGLLGRRLVDLGFTSGARMRLVRKGPAGSLIAVSIRSTVIALRSTEASSITVSLSRG